MRNLIVSVLLLCAANIAAANGLYRHGHHRPHNHSHWVAPLIIGGVLGAALANQVPPNQPPVIIQHYPPQYNLRYVQIYDQSCYCYRWALVSY